MLNSLSILMLRLIILQFWVTYFTLLVPMYRFDLSQYINFLVSYFLSVVIQTYLHFPMLTLLHNYFSKNTTVNRHVISKVQKDSKYKSRLQIHRVKWRLKSVETSRPMPALCSAFCPLWGVEGLRGTGAVPPPPRHFKQLVRGGKNNRKSLLCAAMAALAALHLHGGISRNSKRWNQPTRTIDEWMDTQNAVYTHNEICYSAFKRKDILTHSTTWMNHEGIMLIRGSQRRRDRTVVARGQGRWELGAGV